MWGGWYADTAIMADMKAYLKIAAAALHDTNRSSIAEIAVIASEESYRYTNPLDPSVAKQNYMNRLPLGLAGAPYDIYDILDIEALPERFKIVIFLNIAGREEIVVNYCNTHPEKKVVFTGCDGTDTSNTVYTGDILTTSLLRKFYTEAGVHIYTDTDDAVHANENYIAVHAASAGVKTLRLKETSNIIPLLPEGQAFTNSTITAEFQQYETRLFKINKLK